MCANKNSANIKQTQLSTILVDNMQNSLEKLSTSLNDTLSAEKDLKIQMSTLNGRLSQCKLELTADFPQLTPIESEEPILDYQQQEKMNNDLKIKLENKVKTLQALTAHKNRIETANAYF